MGTLDRFLSGMLPLALILIPAAWSVSVAGRSTGDPSSPIQVRAGDPPTVMAKDSGTGLYFEADFETDDGGFTHMGQEDEWERGTPTNWPYGCLSGSNCWGTDLDASYNAPCDQTLLSPVIDLSSVPQGIYLKLSWLMAFTVATCDESEAYAEIRINGGDWITVWNRPDSLNASVSEDWNRKTYNVSEAAGGTLEIRWRLNHQRSSYKYSGIFVDLVEVKTAFADSFKSAPRGGVAGESLPYSIDIINSGVVNAEGVVLTDPIPAGTAFLNLIGPPAAIFNASMNRVEWSGDIPKGNRVTISFEVLSNAGLPWGTIISNTATVSWPGSPLDLALRADTYVSTGPVVYVDASAAPGGNGSSWQKAFTDLQDALAMVPQGSEIWVAEGTYKATEGIDRSISFQMWEGVGIYGGFTGGETSRNQRDWEAHPAILSGDIGVEGAAADNSRCILIGAEEATLDGFTIRNANGGLKGSGGGMSILGCSPTISNCKFVDNQVTGRYVDSTYERRGGAGIYVEGGQPIIERCLFENNEADGIWTTGGAIAAYDCSPPIRKCTFRENFGYGGALYIKNDNSEISDCEFHDNDSHWDGGAIQIDYGSPVISRCLFIGNTSLGAGEGGAIDCYRDQSRIENCVFFENTSDVGSDIQPMESFCKITNCTFASRNAVLGSGASVSASIAVRGVGSSPTFANCIVWPSPDASYILHVEDRATPTISHCDFKGGLYGPLVEVNPAATIHDGGGNIDADPLYLDPSNEDFRLPVGSPCIDKGTNETPYLPDIDMDGNPRIMNGTVDMGAYERKYGTDLVIEKGDDPDPVNVLSPLTYSLEITNLGPDPAVGITVSDTLPDLLEYVGAQGDGWSCTFSFRTVTCTRDSLALGETSEITVFTRATSEGGLAINQASVTASGGDPIPENNTAFAETTVVALADLSVISSGSPDPVSQGQSLEYTLMVFNDGPSRATDVILYDELPPDVEIPYCDQTDDDGSIDGFGGGVHHATYWNGAENCIQLSGIANSWSLPDQGTSSGWTDMVGNVLLWHLNDFSPIDHTSVSDSSGLGNQGMLITNEAYVEKSVAGKVGRAFTFDGNDDQIILNPFFPFPSGAVTLMFWMRTSNTSKAGSPISYASSEEFNNELLIYDYRNIQPHIHNQKVETGVSANDGNWHHIALTWRSFDGETILFKDGEPVYSGTLAAGATLQTGGSLVVGQEQDDVGGGFDPGQAFLGDIDEVAVFSRVLDPNQIRGIYARQAPGRVGYFDSRIMDASESVSWATLEWLPRRPTLKELPDYGGAESGYPEGNVNMSGNVLLMHMNETTWAGVADEVADSSGLDSHGTAASGANTVEEGRFGRAGSFDGVDDSVSIQNDDSFNFVTNHDFSISVWVKAPQSQPNTQANSNSILEKWSGSGGGYPFALRLYNQDHTNNGLIGGGRYDGVNPSSYVWSSSRINDHTWHHVVFLKDGANLKLFVDGVEEGSANDSTAGSTSNSSPLGLGKRGDGKYYFKGHLDELALFDRPLSEQEIENLFTRGALRLSFQVRVCPDEGCAGIPFTGPDGTAGSTYSELENSSLGPPACALQGGLGNDRFFLYRAMFEGDDTESSPGLQRVEVGPMHYGDTVSTSQGSCFGIQPLVWELGALESGAGASATITVRTMSPGTVTNRAEVAANEEDPQLENNIAIETTVVEAPALPGDCDGSEAVSIGEVQKVIRMHLRLDPAGCGADCDGNGQISIGELQKVINAHLKLPASC